jgi:hypothetical protein
MKGFEFTGNIELNILMDTSENYGVTSNNTPILIEPYGADIKIQVKLSNFNDTMKICFSNVNSWDAGNVKTEIPWIAEYNITAKIFEIQVPRDELGLRNKTLPFKLWCYLKNNASNIIENSFPSKNNYNILDSELELISHYYVENTGSDYYAENVGIVQKINKGELLLSEISYYDNAEFEWFELYNPTDDTIFLYKMSFSDNDNGDGIGEDTYYVEKNIVIFPDSFVLFEYNQNATSICGDVVYGTKSAGINFANSGDQLFFIDGYDNLIELIDFENSWPFVSISSSIERWNFSDTFYGSSYKGNWVVAPNLEIYGACGNVNGTP